MHLGKMLFGFGGAEAPRKRRSAPCTRCSAGWLALGHLGQQQRMKLMEAMIQFEIKDGRTMGIKVVVVLLEECPLLSWWNPLEMVVVLGSSMVRETKGGRVRRLLEIRLDQIILIEKPKPIDQIIR